MRQIILFIALLMQLAMVEAQSPDWVFVPNKLNTPTNVVTALPGSYSTAPYYAADCGYDNSGNILFYIKDGTIYNAAGTVAGSLTTSLGYNAKRIIIIPDPGDCNARLIIHTSGDIFTGGPPPCYHVTNVLCTRIVMAGSSFTVQHNYSSGTIGGGVSQCNLYVSMAVSKPLGGGNRYLYIAGDKSVYKYLVSSTGIAQTQAFSTGLSSSPTDLELSPTGDKLAWSDANSSNGIRFITLNAVGDMQTFFQFPTTTAAYPSYGLEFFNNTQVLVAAGTGTTGGIYKADLSASTSSQIIIDSAFGRSQLEMSLDGRIYAASAARLMGVDPITAATVFKTIPIISKAGYLIAAYYSLPSQLDGEVYSQTFSCTPPCPINVTITGTYTTPLTESQTWIVSSGTTTIPATATVKLDADPAAGYVELNPGFETQPGAVFVAQALDGCGTGIPSRHSSPIVNSKINFAPAKPFADNRGDVIKVYPNPTKGIVTVRHSTQKKVIQLYNASGIMIKIINAENSTSTQIDLSTQPQGVYLLRIDGKMVSKIVKD